MAVKRIFHEERRAVGRHGGGNVAADRVDGVGAGCGSRVDDRRIRHGKLSVIVEDAVLQRKTQFLRAGG